jgi:hypothetical protein
MDRATFTIGFAFLAYNQRKNKSDNSVFIRATLVKWLD